LVAVVPGNWQIGGALSLMTGTPFRNSPIRKAR
jgi:hypothetical protein